MWPCVVFLIRDAKKLIVTALALSAGALALRIAMTLHGAPPIEVYEFTPCRVDALMIGGTLALVLRTGLRPILLRYAWVAFLVILELVS